MKAPIRVRAFAKINLGLKILGKRHDGYHELRTIYQTVGLADHLEIAIRPRGRSTRLECDSQLTSSARKNLVYRAAEAWRKARRFRGGIEITLRKHIPIGAGLGGGSSDAAATLRGLEHLTGSTAAQAELIEVAAGLGSDVPFFLYGGRALGCGRGEEIYPMADLPPRPCLIMFPGFSVSTAEAYQALGLQLTETGATSRINILGKRSPFPLEEWGPAENDFERFVFARWPELAEVKGQLIRAGAETASLTGSGSALFAIFESAQQMSHAAAIMPSAWQIFRTRTLSRAGYLRRLFE